MLSFKTSWMQLHKNNSDDGNNKNRLSIDFIKTGDLW